ncbi:MAG: hypothetical protein ACYDA3_09630 [Gaiellaceae bacterium]
MAQTIAGSPLFSRILFTCAALCLLPGCTASGSRSSFPVLNNEVANLRWDLTVVDDDLLVARLALNEQKRRVRQALADLNLARKAPAQDGGYYIGLVQQDAGHAVDGVRAVENSVTRVDASLSYVRRDLGNLHRVRPTPGQEARLSAALTTGRRAMREATSLAASDLKQASLLRDQIDRYARQAKLRRR